MIARMKTWEVLNFVKSNEMPSSLDALLQSVSEINMINIRVQFISHKDICIRYKGVIWDMKKYNRVENLVLFFKSGKKRRSRGFQTPPFDSSYVLTLAMMPSWHTSTFTVTRKSPIAIVRTLYALGCYCLGADEIFNQWLFDIVWSWTGLWISKSMSYISIISVWLMMLVMKSGN